jgi:molybdate transport system substrate-binding protein
MRSERAERIVAGAALLAAVTAATAQAPEATVTVYAAGSLRAAFVQIARDHEAAHPGARVQLVFGASGLLKDRLQSGEKADVFASANMEHPQALAQAGRAQAVQRFARNALCALAGPGFSLQGQTLVQRLLDPAVRVGTSTPKADPSGDYAFAMFERIESSGLGQPGSAARLKARALQLTGGPTSPPPPVDRNVYAALMTAGAADVFITYCTNAALARQEAPQLQSLAIDERVNVSASYGLAVITPPSDAGRRFADFVLSQPAQQRLAALGFAAP